MRLFRAVRERFSRQGARRPSGRLCTRVALPAVVDFPLDVLRALRALDPMLDGYVMPDGRVWILHLEPNRQRIQTGRNEMRVFKEEDLGMPLVSSLLSAEGFWLVADLPYHEGTSAGAAVRAASLALHATAEQVEARKRLIRAEVDNTNARERMVATIRDRIRSSAKSDWARTWRGRRTFAMR